MYTIEFQKRGLPHAHILLWLDGSNKLQNATDIDKVISVELPHPNLYPKLFKVVKSYCTDQSSGFVWPLVMMGPRKVGPTSGMGQCLARHVRQGTEEVVRHWSPGCADVSPGSVERSGIGDSNNRVGPWEVDPRPHTNYELGRSLCHKSPCGVDDAFGHNTSKEPLEKIQPEKVTFQGWAARMARERLGRSHDGWSQRLGARVGTQVVIPLEVALQLGSPTR